MAKELDVLSQSRFLPEEASEAKCPFQRQNVIGRKEHRAVLLLRSASHRSLERAEDQIETLRNSSSMYMLRMLQMLFESVWQKRL